MATGGANGGTPMSLVGWLDALAGSGPTPGGGAAAGLLAATGAALVEMACNLTIGREKYRAAEPLMLETRTRAAALRAQADTLREEDSSAYDAVSAARALPRATPEEKSARSAAIQQALRYATEVPLRTAALAMEVLQLASAIVEQANPNVISDVGAGALAARAGMDASGLNVRINLVAIKDEQYVARQGAALDSVLARGNAAADRVLAAVHAAIGG